MMSGSVPFVIQAAVAILILNSSVRPTIFFPTKWILVAVEQWSIRCGDEGNISPLKTEDLPSSI